MRFESGDNFLEIEQGSSIENGAVFYVNSSVPFSELPIEFRAQVKQSDLAELKALEDVAEKWADKNGFKRCK